MADRERCVRHQDGSIEYDWLCKALVRRMVAAGGAGLMESYACPFDSFGGLVIEDTDTAEQASTKMAVAANLGIVGIVSIDGQETPGEIS